MTLDEANMTIYYLKEIQESYIEGEEYERHPLPEWYALDKAIETLEQHPSEDCISRQAVDTLVDELARAISDERCCISRGRDTATIIRDILHLPPVTPQPKIGRWVLSGGYWRCSECKEKALLKLDTSKGGCKEYMPIKSNYCPNCGAEMQGVEE